MKEIKTRAEINETDKRKIVKKKTKTKKTPKKLVL